MQLSIMEEIFMKTIFVSFLILAATVFASAAEIMHFGTMYGVDGPFLNSTSLRGVLGDELPWVIKRVDGSLTTSGHLRIYVRGLVFSNDTSVPADLRGINDETAFRGLISCQTDEAVVNILTTEFRATRSGNSNINAWIKMPAECIAPIIFVTSAKGDHWFSVTGSSK
jgi:hypothetical protein